MNFNRSFFIKILNDLYYDCNREDYKDKNFKDVMKFQGIINNIDLYQYELTYVQNRFIAIRLYETNFEDIRNIIFSPLDTPHNIRDIRNKYPISNEIFDYSFTLPKRSSYLIPYDKGDHEVECIKGYLEPSILNAILIYIIKERAPITLNKTLIVFTLKNFDSKWSSLDVLQYLQDKNLNKNNSMIPYGNIIDLDFTSNEKGLYSENSNGKITINSPNIAKSFRFIDEYCKEKNFDLNILRNLQYNSLGDFSYHRELLDYFNMPTYAKIRLKVFTDKNANNKFSTFFMNEPFLVEWKSIEDCIDLLTNILS